MGLAGYRTAARRNKYCINSSSIDAIDYRTISGRLRELVVRIGESIVVLLPGTCNIIEALNISHLAHV